MYSRRPASIDNSSTGTTTMQRSTAASMSQAAANAFQNIPRPVQYTSPVASTPVINGAPHATSLPLQLIALIVSYLDDIADIARVTRTSRLLYYMTLPCLYEKVGLHSYGDMRYINGKPEGFGSGSPLMMGLNGLLTKQHAALVREFRIWGTWKELGVEEFAKGRVPDNSMMLNILLRAATDKMDKLAAFSWELACKPLKTLYEGLACHNTLTSLTLRFPSTRVPRPSVLIPPIANLRAFKALDIDPLCHPDDISMLMLGSKKLEDVRLHFSPRMRQEGDAVTSLDKFFGRCQKARYKLRLKHFALHNFFGCRTLGFEEIFDHDAARSVTFLDTFGGHDPKTIFVDSTWAAVPPDLFTSFESVRTNEVAPQQLQLMKMAKVKMKGLYLVNDKRKKSGFTPSDYSSSSNTPVPETPDSDHDTISLAPEYLDVLMRFHGDGLRKLLLLDVWALSADDVAALIRHCPNLEELGIAINTPDHNMLRLLLPFLRNLRALRILNNEHLTEHMRFMSHEERMWTIGCELAARPQPNMKIVGFGETVYRIGNIVEDIMEDGSLQRRHDVWMADRKETTDFDIWRLDTLDLSVDPYWPSSP